MTTRDLSSLSRGDRIWFAATGLAFAWAKALGDRRDVAAHGALQAFRQFFNANRRPLVLAMSASGFSRAESALPTSAPATGEPTADDRAAVGALASAYFNHDFSATNTVSAAAIGRWWWSDLALRLGETDYIVQGFLSSLEDGPEIDAGSRLTRTATEVVNGSISVGVGTDIAEGAEGTNTSQVARMLALATEQATGVSAGDAEAIELPPTTIVGRRTPRESIPPWAITAGVVGFLTLGGGLVFVLGKKQGWWR